MWYFTAMKRYLFLDFDGVLHTIAGPRNLHLARYLEPVVSELQMHIVISSTWREAYSLLELKRRLGPLGANVAGQTPILDSDGGYSEVGHRQREIEAWLAKNDPSNGNWVALDDNPDYFFRSCKKVFLTDPEIGLSAEVAELFKAWCFKALA